MSDFFDTDEAVRVCRSLGLGILVGLSQLEEAMSAPPALPEPDNTYEIVENLAIRVGELNSNVLQLRYSVVNGTATTPTPDSLTEEDESE